jgi:two-component system chemotaxis response regulator CheY
MSRNLDRVLVVDDAKSMRATLVRMLKGMGVREVEEATNGRTALAQIESRPKYDLILCDHHMPECTGLELLGQLREREDYKDLPFIVVSCEVEPAIMVRALKLGAAHYLPKPVSDEDLRRKIEAVLGRLH